MGQKAHQMILDALAALTAEDETAARKVIAADDEVDYDFNAIKHMLAREIAADPGKVDAALDLLMVIKYLERIGDHAVNLAEWVEFGPHRLLPQRDSVLKLKMCFSRMSFSCFPHFPERAAAAGRFGGFFVFRNGAPLSGELSALQCRLRGFIAKNL